MGVCFFRFLFSLTLDGRLRKACLLLILDELGIGICVSGLRLFVRFAIVHISIPEKLLNFVFVHRKTQDPARRSRVLVAANPKAV